MQIAKANEVLVGAAAGVIATVPMTFAMEELHRLLSSEDEGPLPSREVTEGIYDYLHEDLQPETEENMERLAFLRHYAFGGAAGSLFPLVAPRRLPAAVGAGALYGLTVWTGSYLGLLPDLGVRHHARHDSAARTGMMIAAHAVWGATLGLLLRGRPGLRTASRHPDAAER